MYAIPPMAGKWCLPEHSLHVAVTIQKIELKITTGMDTEHDRHDDLTLWVSNIGWSCDTINVLSPRPNRKESQSSHVHPVSKNKNRTTLCSLT